MFKTEYDAINYILQRPGRYADWFKTNVKAFKLHMSWMNGFIRGKKKDTPENKCFVKDLVVYSNQFYEHLKSRHVVDNQQIGPDLMEDVSWFVMNKMLMAKVNSGPKSFQNYENYDLAYEIMYERKKGEIDLVFKTKFNSMLKQNPGLNEDEIIEMFKERLGKELGKSALLLHGIDDYVEDIVFLEIKKAQAKGMSLYEYVAFKTELYHKAKALYSNASYSKRPELIAAFIEKSVEDYIPGSFQLTLS
jgi:hypothetical protein